jgi:hypothetical protein
MEVRAPGVLTASQSEVEIVTVCRSVAVHTGYPILWRSL